MKRFLSIFASVVLVIVSIAITTFAEDFRSTVPGDCFNTKKDALLTQMGDDYEFVNAGPEGWMSGYYYEHLGLTFVFDDTEDDLYPLWIDAEAPFEVGGARPGMNFSEIQNVLGAGEVYSDLDESADDMMYPRYSLEYIIGKLRYVFYAYNEDGEDSYLYITPNYGHESYILIHHYLGTWYADEDQLDSIEIYEMTEDYIAFAISLYRLVCFETVAYMEADGFYWDRTDGLEMSGKMELLDDRIVMTVDESDFDYISVGTVYEFKTKGE